MWNERATLNICISLRYPIAVNFFTYSTTIGYEI